MRISSTDLKALAVRLQELMGCNGIKNSYQCYSDMANQMQYACEFNADVMLEVIPEFGLVEEARKYIIGKILEGDHAETWPLELLEAQANLLMENATASKTDAPSKEEVEECSDFLPLPPLPHLLQLMTGKEPIGYRAPMIIGLLPVLGTLATGVRFTYNQVETHSLSFISCLEAPSAGGKSFIKRHIDLLLTPIREQDKIERQKEDVYREALRLSRNKKEQPENPKACIRLHGTFSRSSMLQAMMNAQGKHIFMFFPELSSMVTQRKNGSWSNIDDFLKMSFDNDEFSQSYMTSDSFSGSVKLYFNMLVTGTPHSREDFFRDIESGLVQRTAFAVLPDEFGKPNPTRIPYTASEMKAIISIAERLEQQQGHVSCPELEKAILEWCNEKGETALETGSRACDMLRRRSAVIGYRAGILCFLLEGGMTEKVIPFATWVAEYVFRSQTKLFGEQIEALFSGKTVKGKGSKILDSLPESFTREDVINAYIKQGDDRKKAARKATNVVDQWQRISKKIRRLDDGRYAKAA